MPKVEFPAQTNVSLAPYTTIKLGGPAKYFITANTPEELVQALAQARQRHLPVHIMGGGSNTIFSDSGFNGLVIHLALTGVDLGKDGRVRAAAGVVWDELVQQTIAAGLSGFECMSGIPGSVGATPIQNVGAYGQEVAQTITRVEAIDRQSLMTVAFSHDDCHFEYRNSRFKDQDADKFVIISVEYQLTPDGQPTITYPQLIDQLGGHTAIERLGSTQNALQRVRDAVINLRASKSMIVNDDDPNSRSCGSFFVNPIVTEEQLKNIQQHSDPPSFPAKLGLKIPAAWLIEQAGFTTGYRLGGVGISTNHPLALVNYDGTTVELLKLADQIQSKIARTFGIELQREPVLIKNNNGSN